MTARQTLAGFAEDYFARRRHMVAVRTLKSEQSSVGKIVRAWDSLRKVPRSMDSTWLEDFLFGPGGMAEQLPNTDSFNTQQQHIKTFLEWVSKRPGGVPVEVLDAIRKLPVTPKDYTRISIVQMHDVIDGCPDEWERWVLTLASQTLGRDGELRRLALSDFNLTNNRLRWYRPKTKQYDELPVTGFLADGYRRWTTFLQDRVQCPLDRSWYAVPLRTFDHIGRNRLYVYHPEQPRVRGVAMVIQGHVSRVTGIPVEALKGQGVHLVRRSMARALYEQLKVAGEADPIRVVMAMLGHANVATTEKYIGLRADRERRNDLLAGSRLLSVSSENVVKLGVDSGADREDRGDAGLRPVRLGDRTGT